MTHPARKFAAALVVLDSLVVLAAFNGLAMARGLISPGSFLLQPFLIPLGVLLVALYLIDGYRLRTDMLSLDYASEHTIALLSALVGLSVLTFVVLTEFTLLQQSRGVLALGYLVAAPLTLGYRRWLHLRLTGDRRDRCFLFVGKSNEYAEFAAEYAASGMNQRLIPILTDHVDPLAPAASVPARLFAVVEREGLQVEGIIVRESTAALSDNSAERLVALHFAGVPTLTLERFHERYWRKIPLYRLNQVWLFQEGFAVAREPAFERAKRIIDILAAGFALLLLAPLLAVLALLVRLFDGAPVLFRQERVGLNRRPFTLAKFRTLRPGPDAADVEARVTRLGRWLRRSRCDELPQLWNVLRGDMSLIGPRAEWSKLAADYEKSIPCYHFRHLVRPGITGWAQVNRVPGAGRDDTMQKLEYDLYYIKYFSFRLDATIVLKTIHTMLFGKGR